MLLQVYTWTTWTDLHLLNSLESLPGCDATSTFGCAPQWSIHCKELNELLNHRMKMKDGRSNDRDSDQTSSKENNNEQNKLHKALEVGHIASEKCATLKLESPLSNVKEEMEEKEDM